MAHANITADATGPAPALMPTALARGRLYVVDTTGILAAQQAVFGIFMLSGDVEVLLASKLNDLKVRTGATLQSMTWHEFQVILTEGYCKPELNVSARAALNDLRQNRLTVLLASPPCPPAPADALADKQDKHGYMNGELLWVYTLVAELPADMLAAYCYGNGFAPMIGDLCASSSSGSSRPVPDGSNVPRHWVRAPRWMDAVWCRTQLYGNSCLHHRAKLTGCCRK